MLRQLNGKTKHFTTKIYFPLLTYNIHIHSSLTKTCFFGTIVYPYISLVFYTQNTPTKVFEPFLLCVRGYEVGLWQL